MIQNTKDEQKQGKEETLSQSEKVKIMGCIMLVILLIGIIMTLIYSVGIENSGESFFSYAKYASVSVLLAGTSLLIGIFVGFLFGLPRSIQESENTDNFQHRQVPYSANTNLEEISYWLTKILVGVGLTQFLSLPSYLKNLSNFLAQTFGNNEQQDSSVYVIIIILYFVICGFLSGYIATRLFFTTALAYADNATLKALGQELSNTIKQTLSEQEEKAGKDAKALLLVDVCLESTDGQAVDITELEKTIFEASEKTKRFIFSQVKEIRKNNWDNGKDKDQISQTIPILESLLKYESQGTSDNIVKDLRYKISAELGYALKDQEHPNWEDSEKRLTEAIELRGSPLEKGNKIYEFNRADCRIKLNQKLTDKELESKNRKEIIDDIAVAVSRQKLRRIIADNLIFQQWIQINNVTLDDLNTYSQPDVIEEIPDIIRTEKASDS